MSRCMQQWELKQKQKIHEKKIKNAKPTIKNPKSVIIEIEDSDISASETQDLSNLLKKYSLQQHHKKLQEMGETIQSLTQKTTSDLDQLCENLKILPGQRAKFNKMIRDVHSTPTEYARNNSIYKEKPQSNSTKSTKDRYTEHEHRHEREHGHEHEHEHDDDALGLYNAEGSTNDIDVENLKLKQELEDAMNKIKLLESQLNEPESPIVHSKGKKLSQVEVKENVEEQKLDPFEPLPDVPNKNFEVGVSYDSSKLRSTLHHIDLEEMSRALSKVILKIVLHGMDVEKNRNLVPSLRESLASLPDLYEDYKKDTVKSKSSLLSSIGTYSMDYSQDSFHPLPILSQITEKSYEGSPQKHFIEAGEVKVPKDIQEIFNTQFDDYNTFTGIPPTEDEIYNFCKNVIARSRMEKEVSILCLIYMERFIEKTGIYVSEKNWKKLLFMCLVLASKIWDDESYENVHFAQVFSMITLREMNAMELIFLSMIDYEVNIKNSDYAKYYFVLRTNAQKNNKSFPLKPLDVEIVLKLQHNSNNAEAALKEKMAESLTKTM